MSTNIHSEFQQIIAFTARWTYIGLTLCFLSKICLQMWPLDPDPDLEEDFFDELLLFLGGEEDED